MKMTCQRFAVMLLVAVLGTSTAHATLFSVAAGDLGAAYNPGLIPIGAPAISVSGFVTTGYFNNPSVDYSYTLDSTNPASPFNPDYYWLGSGGTTPATGAIWTFATRSSDYYLYPAIDHLPLPAEALESSLWGSPDGGSTWLLGTLVELYEQGWNLSGIADDGASRWSFSVPVDMVAGVVGLTQGIYTYADGDYEIDAVMQVPEPGIAVLLSGGVASAVVWSRVWRRRRRVQRPPA
ncbi:MAG: hypothetical protein WD063_04305 [Pirellulales bacterium]